MKAQNKIITIVARYFAIIVLMVFTSCQDFLEEDTSGTFVTDAFFTSEADFDLAVNSIYSSLVSTANSNFSGPAGGRIGQNAFFSPHMGGDDVMSHFGLNKAPYRNVDAFQATATSVTLPKLWNTYYETIYRANIVIQAAKNTEVLEDDVNPHLAQAKMLRAFSYFNLIKIWGEVPFHTEDNLGVNPEIAPSSYAKIMALVIEDLEWAISDEAKMQTSAPSDKPSQLTIWAAKTLLADVYLKESGWPTNDNSYFRKAADLSLEVINSGVYSMYNDFADLWTIENHNTSNPEIVFYFSQSFSAGGAYANGQTRTTMPPEEKGWTDVMSQNGWYYAFPEGYRKEVTFHTVFTDKNKTRWEDSILKHPFYAKYRSGSKLAGDGSGTHPHNTNRNTVIYRLPYLYFTYAEAQTMADGAPNALSLELINKVRRRASDDRSDLTYDYNAPDPLVDLPSGMSANDFRQAVFEEKGWELACEQHRWNDLVRREKVVEMNLLHRVAGEDTPVIGRDIASLPKEHFYYLPYQNAEMTKNNLLFQKDGYY